MNKYRKSIWGKFIMISKEKEGEKGRKEAWTDWRTNKLFSKLEYKGIPFCKGFWPQPLHLPSSREWRTSKTRRRQGYLCSLLPFNTEERKGLKGKGSEENSAASWGEMTVWYKTSRNLQKQNKTPTQSKSVLKSQYRAGETAQWVQRLAVLGQPEDLNSNLEPIK